MIALLQRVSHASVSVDQQIIASIGKGMLILLGVEQSDEQRQVDKLSHKVANYRMFADENGKMNLNIRQIEGEALVVSQFTLVANTQQGNRPGFSSAATPEVGKRHYQAFVSSLQQQGVNVKTGQFGADMQVSLTNDGPVTFYFHM